MQARMQVCGAREREGGSGMLFTARCQILTGKGMSCYCIRQRKGPTVRTQRGGSGRAVVGEQKQHPNVMRRQQKRRRAEGRDQRCGVYRQVDTAQLSALHAAHTSTHFMQPRADHKYTHTKPHRTTRATRNHQAYTGTHLPPIVTP